MKRQIRPKLFNTGLGMNHSVYIDFKNQHVNTIGITDSGRIVSKGGRFGYSSNKYHSIQEKIDCLVTYLYQKHSDFKRDDIEEFEDCIIKVKRDSNYIRLCEVIMDHCATYLRIRSNEDMGKWYPVGWMDKEAEDVVKNIFNDSDSIAEFLFNPQTVLETKRLVF